MKGNLTDSGAMLDWEGFLPEGAWVMAQASRDASKTPARVVFWSRARLTPAGEQLLDRLREAMKLPPGEGPWVQSETPPEASLVFHWENWAGGVAISSPDAMVAEPQLKKETWARIQAALSSQGADR